MIVLENGVKVEILKNTAMKGMGVHVCSGCYFYEQDIACDTYLKRDTDDCSVTYIYQEVK